MQYDTMNQPPQRSFPQPQYTGSGGNNRRNIMLLVVLVVLVAAVVVVVLLLSSNKSTNNNPQVNNPDAVKNCGGSCANGGTCTNGVCQCSDGSVRDNCGGGSTPETPATQNACAQNNGGCPSTATCSLTSTNKVKCTCTGGKTLSSDGKSCVTASTNKCSPNPCQNSGSCNANSGACTCRAGFSGELCEIEEEPPADPCKPNPCENGGTCTSTGTCKCPAAYNGDQCQNAKPATLCAAGTCKNGGTCVEADGSCKCATGYSGQKCETDACATVSCQNGGKCQAGVCQCATGFSGSKCETAACTKSCGSHGKCVITAGAQACNCTDSYTGADCATAPTPTGGATLSAGCGKATTLKNGEAKVASGRQYTLRLPNNYNNTKPYRLIMAPHCLGANMQQVVKENYYNLIGQAKESAILVAPNGAGSDNGWGNGAADLALFDDMYKLFDAELCFDKRQVYSTGFSYGGAMSFALACARPEVYRGVLILDGGVVSGCQGGTKPVAYFQVHGVSDSVFPIAQSASGMRDKFMKNNGCQPPSGGWTQVGSGSRKWACQDATGCKTEYPLKWCTFDGGHVGDGANLDGGWLPKESWKWMDSLGP